MAREGNDDAFSHLVSRFLGMIKALSSQYAQGLLEPADLAQEGLVALFAAVQSYAADKHASFSTFAYACIRNRMVSACRRRLDAEVISDEDELSVAETVESPETVVVQQEEWNHLQERLRKELTVLEYQVLIAHWSGYSYREIAQRLDITEKAVDNALQRLRRKLTSHRL